MTLVVRWKEGTQAPNVEYEKLEKGEWKPTSADEILQFQGTILMNPDRLHLAGLVKSSLI